jgi:transposase
MYMDMELWERVRRKVLVEGLPKRQVMREEGLAWDTLKKILAHSAPPGYRQKQVRPKRKLGEHWDWMEQVLAGDKQLPRKQRHTAKRLWDRLKAERGFKGGYTVVKEAVRELSRRSQEVFMPLSHRPGTMQMDFGQALARIGGVLRKVHFAVFALPHSDAVYLRAYERECTETFWDGHVHALAYFGGVPTEITYDNTKVAVGQIIGGGKERKLTNGFLHLQSHYLFDYRFCRVARPNEKGVVEGMVKFTRLNFMVPVPQVGSFAELNERWEQQCREDLKRRVRGQSQTKAQLLEEDRQAFRPLPVVPFEASRKESRISSSLSLVRFDDNDYSVPVAYAHHTVTLKGSCEEVRIYSGPEEIARHERIWAKEQIRLDPVHYLALLERKPGSLDYARPMAGLELPECFALLRRRLEAEREGDGTREYIRVLRLLENHRLPQLRQAVEKALAVGAMTRDAIAQFLNPQPQWRHTVFRLDGHPHLRGVKIDSPDVRAYRELLATVGGAA